MDQKAIPAFPVPLNQGQCWQGMAPCDGMTLRDYFAAKAMAVVWTEIPENADREFALDRLGRYSYAMADAMLSARAQ